MRARSPGEIPGLTGSRGLGAAAVVFVHVLGLTAPHLLSRSHLSPVGDAALMYFFALSAFLLGQPFLRALLGGRRRPDIARFATQRALRIYPAYLVIFVISDLALRAVYVHNTEASQMTSPLAGTGRITDPLHLLSLLSLVGNLLPTQLQTGLNPAWSLTTEVCFYVLLPLLFLVAGALTRRGVTARRAALGVAVGLIAVGWVSRLGAIVWARHSHLSVPLAGFGPNGTAVLSRSLLACADAFGVGLLAAMVYLHVRAAGSEAVNLRVRRAAGLVFWAGLAVAVIASRSQAQVVDAACAVAGAALIVLMTTPLPGGAVPRLTRVMDLRPFDFLGRISLSSYLWHYPILIIAVRHGWTGSDSAGGALRSMVIVFGLTVLAATLSYYLVEEPAMRLVRPRRPAVTRPRVAIVHDYLTQRGGAERVVVALTRAFPDAPVYTALYSPDQTFVAFADVDVRPHWLNRIGWLRHNHRLGLLLMPLAFSFRRVDADVVIASSSGWAHGVRTSGRVAVYCYSPARWLYQSRRYLGEHASLPAKALLWAARVPLRVWDKRAARRAELYIAISSVVQERIAAVYGRDSVLVTPPLSHRFAALAQAPSTQTPSTSPYLCVSRLLPYKNVDVIVEAFTATPQRTLVVVGSGPDLARLAERAGPNIRFVTEIPDAELIELYRSCRGLVALSYEDFGLTPLEAAAVGRPSVVLRWGGYLDTMVEGVTAVFADEPTAPALLAALDELEARSWDPAVLAAHTHRFAEAEFAERMQAIVAALSPATVDTLSPHVATVDTAEV